MKVDLRIVAKFSTKITLIEVLNLVPRVSRGSFRQFDGLHDPILSKTEIQAKTQDE
eukprot:SAG11_NODE_9341_length_922_cov_4.124239_1_plen_55_part_01